MLILPKSVVHADRNKQEVQEMMVISAEEGIRKMPIVGNVDKSLLLLLMSLCFLTRLASIGGDPSSVYGGGGGGGCYKCQFREEVRNMTLEGIKYRILRQLGLDGAPNVTGFKLSKNFPEMHPLKEILGMYDDGGQQKIIRHRNHHKNDDTFEYGGDDYDEQSFKRNVMVIPKPCTKSRCSKYLNEYNPVLYSFENKTVNGDLLNAKLKLYQNKLKVEEGQGPFNVCFTILKFDSRRYEKGHQPYVEIQSKEVTLADPGPIWFDIDMRKQLENHFKEEGQSDLQLVIRAEYTARNLTGVKVPIVLEYKKSEESPVAHFSCPYISIHLEEHKTRPKRNALECDMDSQEKNCCRYNLTVDFEDFKWDFVIAPRSYQAYFCAGECPLGVNQHSPHTHVAQMAGVGPCCGPRKLKAISMLYFDAKGNIIFGKLPGMVVERCGCF